MSKSVLTALCVGAVVLAFAASASAAIIPMSFVVGDPNARFGANPWPNLTDSNTGSYVYSGDSNEQAFYFVMTPAAGGTFQLDNIQYWGYEPYTTGTRIYVTVGDTLVGGHISGGVTEYFIDPNGYSTGAAFTATTTGTGSHTYLEIGYSKPDGTGANTAGKTGGTGEVKVYGSVPEPVTMSLLAVGAAGGLLRRRRTA